MLQHVAGLELSAGASNDGQADLLAQPIMGHRVGGDLEHAGVAQRQFLYAGGVDVMAAAYDQVLLAPDDAQRALAVELPQVAAHEPAVGVE